MEAHPIGPLGGRLYRSPDQNLTHSLTADTRDRGAAPGRPRTPPVSDVRRPKRAGVPHRPPSALLRTDPRLDERLTRLELAKLVGKNISTFKKMITRHGLVEETLPGDGRGTRVMRLGELVSRGLYELPSPPAAGQGVETVPEIISRRAAERENDHLRRQLAAAEAGREAVQKLLQDKQTEITRLARWIDSLIKGVA